jgi:hypothetical protein
MEQMIANAIASDLQILSIENISEKKLAAQIKKTIKKWLKENEAKIEYDDMIEF